MTSRINVTADIDKELEDVEEEIATQKKITDDLVWRRSELLAYKQDLDMYELFDCITEKGLTACEAINIINSYEKLSR